jgi:hypothetical protein
MAALVVLAAFSPATQEKAAPVPSGAGSVPITVRVFDGKRFVSGLTLEDFEIEEAGRAVPLDSTSVKVHVFRSDDIDLHRHLLRDRLLEDDVAAGTISERVDLIR